jgi:hypothetical protein
MLKERMARLEGETSNELFETLAEWDATLNHLRGDHPQASP